MVDTIEPEQKSKIIDVELRPGETFSTFMKVTHFDPSTSSTWETGTEHVVVIEYKTPTTANQSVSMKVIVR